MRGGRNGTRFLQIFRSERNNVLKKKNNVSKRSKRMKTSNSTLPLQPNVLTMRLARKSLSRPILVLSLPSHTHTPIPRVMCEARAHPISLGVYKALQYLINVADRKGYLHSDILADAGTDND